MTPFCLFYANSQKALKTHMANIFFALIYKHQTFLIDVSIGLLIPYRNLDGQKCFTTLVDLKIFAKKLRINVLSKRQNKLVAV